mmetsp:Transcript_45052/g.72386  ORF Transcript_45052/g.72386 Transcript_45052/m.72386 type:complete len:298 (+) Transcript_45052:765-1658(+)
MNVSPSTTIRSDERSDERSIKSSESARTGLSQSQKLSAVRRPVRRSRSSGRKGPGTRNRTYSAKTYSAKTYTPARPSKTTGRHVLIAPWEKPERVTKLSRKVVPAPMRKESVNRKKVIGVSETSSMKQHKSIVNLIWFLSQQKSSRKEIPIRGKMTFGVGKATAPWDRPEISIKYTKKILKAPSWTDKIQGRKVFAPHQPSKEIKERFSKKMITPVRSDAMPRASSRRHLHQGSHLKSGGAPQVETLNHPGSPVEKFSYRGRTLDPNPCNRPVYELPESPPSTKSFKPAWWHTKQNI